MATDVSTALSIAPRRTGSGLERIVRGAPAESSYGWTENLSPSELQAISVLDQLFEMPDIGDFILQSLLVPLDDASLLQPQHFAKALSTAVPQLRAAADADPSLALELGRCAGVMSHVEDMCETLRLYTTALLQG
ncbi:hypothetical protein [Rhizobacter sp. SG703]|uniref:type III secretion apparatus assembly protein SctX n=1 Tax=Rhizobacter sp. SG703 TaxID=2587140 RepID=UPI00144878ED|nr:hypothetical protein [Rhizobacter sp. SG703]NKI94074.1 hypothetical protein [Rhizobacter sp. SG703]